MLKELSNTLVNVKTQDEYDELMSIYELAGWKWSSGNDPSKSKIWSRYKENTCVEINNIFSYSDIGYFSRSGNQIISLSEFKRLQRLGAEDTPDTNIKNIAKGAMSILRTLGTKITISEPQKSFYFLGWCDIRNGEIVATEAGKQVATEYELLGYSSLEEYAHAEIKRLKAEEKTSKSK